MTKVLRFLLLLWLAAAQVNSHAAVTGTAMTLTLSNSGYGGSVSSAAMDGLATYGGGFRTVSAWAGNAGGVVVATPVSAVVNGGSLAMQAIRTIPIAGVLKFAAKGLVAGYLFDNVALPLAGKLWDQFRCRQQAGNLSMAECDSGTAPVNAYPTPIFCTAFQCNGGDSDPSYQGLVSTLIGRAVADWNRSNPPSQSRTAKILTGSPTYTFWGGTSVSGSQGTSYSTCDSQGGNCTAVVSSESTGQQFLAICGTGSSAYQAAGTANAPVCGTKVVACANGNKIGFDGRCSTGTYSPATSDQAAAQALSGMGGDFSGAGASGGWDAPGLVKEALTKGADAQPFTSDPSPGAVSLSGPSSVSGTPVVTSTPAQNGQPASTTTATPTANVTYSGNTYNTTTSIVTTVVNGSTTTTSTQTGAPTLPPQPTDCDKHPTSVGCTDLGDAGAPDQIPNTDVPTSSGNTPFSELGGCPAPFDLSFTVGGRGYTYAISNQPLCDLMTTMRPIFLALFAAAAAFVFYDGISKATA